MKTTTCITCGVTIIGERWRCPACHSEFWSQRRLIDPYNIKPNGFPIGGPQPKELPMKAIAMFVLLVLLFTVSAALTGCEGEAPTLDASESLPSCTTTCPGELFCQHNPPVGTVCSCAVAGVRVECVITEPRPKSVQSFDGSQGCDFENL